MAKHFPQKVFVFRYYTLVLLSLNILLKTLIDALAVEEKVNYVIQAAMSVKRTSMPSNDLNQMNVTLLPGEVYPDDQVYVIDIMNNVNNLYLSREACCGTHIQNTSDIIHFCLVYYKCLSNECTLMALTGPLCTNAKIFGEKLLEKTSFVENLINSMNLNNVSPEKVTMLYNIYYEYYVTKIILCR